jgi:hypothetical protein
MLELFTLEGFVSLQPMLNVGIKGMDGLDFRYDGDAVLLF